MKKALCIVLVFLLATKVFADTRYQERLTEVKKELRIKNAVYWGGYVLVGAGLLVLLANEGGDDASFLIGIGIASAGSGISLFTAFDIGPLKEQKRRLEYVVGHDRLSSREKQAVAAGKIFIGMSEELLLASWGEPSDINTSTGSWGTNKQYVYSGYQYVYVENGVITSLQS